MQLNNVDLVTVSLYISQIRKEHEKRRAKYFAQECSKWTNTDFSIIGATKQLASIKEGTGLATDYILQLITNRRVLDMAVEDLKDLLREQGYKAYKARKRDKDNNTVDLPFLSEVLSLASKQDIFLITTREFLLEKAKQATDKMSETLPEQPEFTNPLAAMADEMGYYPGVD